MLRMIQHKQTSLIFELFLGSNDNIVLLSGDKDSCVVILDKSDYFLKVNELIEKDISEGVYQYATLDPTHALLLNFRAFFYDLMMIQFYYRKIKTHVSPLLTSVVIYRKLMN